MCEDAPSRSKAMARWAFTPWRNLGCVMVAASMANAKSIRELYQNPAIRVTSHLATILSPKEFTECKCCKSLLIWAEKKDIISRETTKRYLVGYQIVMAQYDDICEEAIANYGLISTERAAELGVHRKELYDWVRLGRLEKCARGLFRIAHYLPTEYDHYAMAVAIVGGDAWLWGDAVLAMHNLALVNPLRYKVAVKRNVRKALPEWIEIVHRFNEADASEFNGRSEEHTSELQSPQ